MRLLEDHAWGFTGDRIGFTFFMECRGMVRRMKVGFALLCIAMTSGAWAGANAGTCGVVKVRVLAGDPSSSEPEGPAQGVTVRLDPAESKSASNRPDATYRGESHTDANGVARFLAVPPGRYVAEVYLAGFETEHLEFRVRASRTVLYEVEMAPVLIGCTLGARKAFHAFVPVTPALVLDHDEISRLPLP